MLSEGIAVSPLNTIPEMRDSLPAKVIISDVTLREGEESTEVTLDLEGKLAIAHRLDAIGVAQIEIGWPGKVDQDREALRILKQEGLHAQIQVMAGLHDDEWRAVIDATIEGDPDGVTLLHTTSDIRLQTVEHLSRREVLERIAEGVNYAASTGKSVTFAPTDAARTDLGFLERAVSVAVDEGAHRIMLADTVGGAAPEAMKFLVSKVTSWIDVPIHVHCHNDFGLALANALAAVQAGATIVDTSVNGIGARSGIPCLDELAASLELLYGIHTGIDLSALTDLSQSVSQLTKLAMYSTKPVVGKNAFCHTLHLEQVLKYPAAFEALPPELVGNERIVPS